MRAGADLPRGLRLRRAVRGAERRAHGRQGRGRHPRRRRASANRSASSPSAIRNILRIVDFLPVFYVVGVISHGGDARAINASAISPPERSSCATGSPASASATRAPPTVPVEAVATWDVSALDQVDLATIHQFLDRRLALPLPVRDYFASELAARVAPKVVGRAVRHASRVPARRRRRRQAGPGVMHSRADADARACTRASCASRAGGMVAIAAVWPVLPVHPPIACPLRARDRHPVPVLRDDARGRRRGARSPRHVARVQPRRDRRVAARGRSRSSGPRG